MSGWFASSTPLIIAHRGANFDAPENTITAFALAAEQQADGIELDVQLSADGVPVIIHDSTVNRTTNGSGAVSKLTRDQLEALDAGDGRPIPTLDQLFETFGPTLLYNVELKSGLWPDPNLAAAVAERIEGHHLEEHVLVSSFNLLAIRQARRTLSSRTPVAHLRLSGLSSFKHQLVKAAGDNPHHKLVNGRYMAWAARQKLLVNVWTVDDPAEAQRLANLGVTSIITNQPGSIRSSLSI
ncbi:MAG: glycerophosphodiester phosphodiesterase family protein [Candidatus Promineifilaceae bacterium]